jgi:hypothetical protein
MGVGASVATIVLFFTMSGAAQAQTKKPNLGLVMWSACSCATYAELSGNEPEQKRLFNIGYTAGRKFLDGIKDQTITEADRREAPIGVLIRLGGPSIDFMLGRIFEGANEDAFDHVVKEDNNGLPLLNPSDWADGELKVTKARNKFRGQI